MCWLGTGLESSILSSFLCCQDQTCQQTIQKIAKNAATQVIQPSELMDFFWSLNLLRFE